MMKNSDSMYKVYSILSQNNSLSVNVGKMDFRTMKNLDRIILYTLEYYGMEARFGYFTLLTRGLMSLALKGCRLEKCRLKLIKDGDSFSLQVFSEKLNEIINKREFIEYINDLAEKEPEGPYYTDLYFLKRLFEMKQFEPDNISYSDNTIELKISDRDLSEETWNEIRESVISYIDTLPPLQENLVKLEEMINSGVFDMNSIAAQTGTDPGLSMDVLKIVNSGAYVLNSPVENIQSALKFLGLRELHNLIMTLSIQKILSVPNRDMINLWHRSCKSAFYACQIAKDLGIKANHRNSIYTSGLLHDIGEFPITGLLDEDSSLLSDYCSRYKISFSDIEDALSGIGHCDTGYLMAEKWNLPDTLKLVMRYHHTPDEAPEKIRNLNDLIYLADCLVCIEDGHFDLQTINQNVLKRQRIESFEEFRIRFQNLNDLFEKADLWH